MSDILVHRAARRTGLDHRYGVHRRLRTDLTLTWGRRTVPLTCANAFFYNLQVTKEDITG